MGRSTKSATAIALLGIVFGCASALAAEDKSVPEVPAEDIFGFTSPTDIGNPGDIAFANENDGRLGKRDGRYRVLDTKYEFSRTLPDDWWIAGSLFGTFHHTRDVTGLPNLDRNDFDGLSFEIERRVLKRSAGNPLAISLAVEPRWSRIDGTTGGSSNGLGAAFKIFADAVVVPDQLFWGANLQWTPQAAQDPMNRSHWMDSSTTLASMALALQVSKSVYIGAETRLLSVFASAWPNHNLGNALYLGPTWLWKITDKVSLNVTYQPQIAGHAAGNAAPLDLDNFERAQFRVKLAVALN